VSTFSSNLSYDRKAKDDQITLHRAARYGTRNAVRDVLSLFGIASYEQDAFVKINEVDYARRTPLFLAAWQGSVEIVRELIA